MLGTDLTWVLRDAGHEVTPTDLSDVDITDAGSCAVAVAGHDVVVNTAAYTAVDRAESDEATAFRINAVGPATLARAVHAAGARMVQVSTDYVFAGDGSTPYAEDAPIAPKSAYGRTKAAGEWAVRAECPQSYIVRTAWLYGENGPNFIKTMARLAGERETVSVVADQTGQPTWTVDLSRYIADVLGAEVPFGTYHGTSEGETTWFGFAQAVFEELGLAPDRVRPISTDEFPQPAPRPAYSVLGHNRTDAVGVGRLPHWRVRLAETVADVVRDTN